MGKRMHLDRLEKQFELLKRDLNMSGGTISGSPTCTLGATTLSSTLTYASGLNGVVPPISTAAPTALAAAGALAKNTTYKVTDTDTAIYSLPARADSTAGDWIEVWYSVDVDNGAIHDYGTAGEDLALSSILYKATDATHSQVWAVDVAASLDDYIKLTGVANGSVGIGTHLTFVFNGTAWHVEAWVYGKGAGSAAALAQFDDDTGAPD